MFAAGAHIGWADQCESALQLTHFDQTHTDNSELSILCTCSRGIAYLTQQVLYRNARRLHCIMSISKGAVLTKDCHHYEQSQSVMRIGARPFTSTKERVTSIPKSSHRSIRATAVPTVTLPWSRRSRAPDAAPTVKSRLHFLACD